MASPHRARPRIRNRAALLAGAPDGPERQRRARAVTLAETALWAVDPYQNTRDCLGNAAAAGLLDRPVVIFAFGKAALAMAQAALDTVPVVGGIVHAFEAQRLGPLVVERASHPTPGPDAAAQGHRMLVAAERLGPHDIALCLISGGGSAMLEAPRDGITIADIQRETRRLMHAGADITQLNVARRRLSRVKGGGLARAIAPAQIINIVLSDVPGAPLEVVASGPTLGASELPMTTFLAADNQTAVDAVAKAGGIAAWKLPISGEARAVGRRLVPELRDRLGGHARRGFVAGGETTVTVSGDGFGGRNTELGAAALVDWPGGLLLTLATDGVDGRSDAAGALVDDAVARLGIDPSPWLDRNDTYTLLSGLGATLDTGPTGTNVADLVVWLP